MDIRCASVTWYKDGSCIRLRLHCKKKNLNPIPGHSVPDLKSFLYIDFTWELKLTYFWNRFLIPIVQIKWGTQNLNLETIFNLMKLFSKSNKEQLI